MFLLYQFGNTTGILAALIYILVLHRTQEGFEISISARREGMKEGHDEEEEEEEEEEEKKKKRRRREEEEDVEEGFKEGKIVNQVKIKKKKKKKKKKKDKGNEEGFKNLEVVKI